MNKPRVFADFHNADAKGRVRLNCAGTVVRSQTSENRDAKWAISYYL